MKTGPSGALAQRFLTSKITPLLVGASLLAGVGGMLATPREEEPQIRVPMIDVAAGLPGATPREVERRLAEPLERAIWEIPGIEYVYSASYPDGVLVTARFKVGTDPEVALTRLYGKLLANADRVPPGATPPLVTLHGIDEVPILTLTLSGGADAGDGYLLRRQANELAGELKRIPDVAQVSVTGGAPREVRVTLDPQALAARGLSAATVLQALGVANASTPAGTLVAGDRSVPVRVGHLLRNADQVRDVVVGVSGDRAVRLREVAQVVDGPAEPTQYVGYLAGGSQDGKTFEPATTIAIAKRPGTNAATIGDEVLRRGAELRGRVLASDVRVTVTRNYGATASEKARELLLHILIATLGVVLLVWIALSWREAVVVLVAVPVTLALTLLVYRLYGYTLNRITLFALVFAIGILVDDAIVVVENIARHLGLKEREPAEAAVVAVDEVGNPTILATLTVIAAILPMAFVSGLMGPYMRPIPVGASVAMLFSLAVAFIVTPYLALRLVRGHAPAAAGPGPSAPAAASRVARSYRRLLESLLGDRRRRWRAYGIVALLLVLSVALVPLKLVTVKMLPFDNKSEFQLIVDMPQGTTLEHTGEVAQALALTVARDRAVHDVQTYVGVPAPFNFNGLVRHYFLRRGPTVADVQVNLVPKGKRPASHAVALRLRPAVDSVARRYGAAVKLAEIPPGPPVQSTLTAEIYGPDYATQIAAAERVRDVFRATPGVVDVDWSAAAPHAEVDAAVGQAEAARAGTNPRDVAQTIAAAMGGATVGLLHDDAAAEPVAIRLELPQVTRGSVGDLEELPVATPRGARALGTLASLDSAPAPQPIFHKNLRPVVYVTGDVAGRLESPAYAMLAMGDSLARVNGGLPIHWAASPTLTERPLLVWDGEWRITYEVFRDLGIAFAAVLGLIYLLVVAWFQSFKTPLVIMAPIPLTLVGILPAHALTGAFFTATSMIGMIALAGIIVRNSILLADFVELGLERGESLRDAVIASGLVRARPIVLTAAAVVIGGLVMVTDPIFQGLGIALIGGAIVATALTLVAVPLLYFEAHQ